MSEFDVARIDALVTSFRAAYPNFKSFREPGRLEQEELGYKAEAAAHAQAVIDDWLWLDEQPNPAEHRATVFSVLDGPQPKNRLNLVSWRARMQLDEAIKPDAAATEFGDSLRRLLAGASRDAWAEEFDRLADWLKNRGCGPSYANQVLSACLALYLPDRFVFIKPEAIDGFLEYIGAEQRVSRKRLSASSYAAVLELFAGLRSHLEALGPRDMFDLQSFAWTAHALAQNEATDLEPKPNGDDGADDDQDRLVNAATQALVERLHGSVNLILAGPPGTGKTWRALQALRDLNPLPRKSGPSFYAMTANPSEWSWRRLVEDSNASIGFEGWDVEKGKFKKLKKHFDTISVGDLVVGYESNPSKRVVTIARVRQIGPCADNPEGREVTLAAATGVGDLGKAWTYDKLKNDPVLAASEPVRNGFQGTLFRLEEDEFNHLVEEFEAPARAAVDAVVGQRAVRRVERVTFHPSYAYEDFVVGLRPVLDGPASGSVRYEIKAGIFKRLCERAMRHPNARFYLLIDELNRGNLPRIFGELIALLEPDKRAVGAARKIPGESYQPLDPNCLPDGASPDDWLQSRTTMPVELPFAASNRRFVVPDNLHVIGTMNTADRSIALMDFALRRRFAFIWLGPDFGDDVFPQSGANARRARQVFERLNAGIEALKGRDYCIGHSYLIKALARAATDDDVPGTVGVALRESAIPLLMEYFHGDWPSLERLLGGDIVVQGDLPAWLQDEEDDDKRWHLHESAVTDELGASTDGKKPPAKLFEALAKHLSLTVPTTKVTTDTIT